MQFQNESEENRNIILAIANRLSWLQQFSEIFGLIFTLDEAEISADGNIKLFRPKPKLAAQVATHLEMTAKANYNSRDLGLSPPNGEDDGDFAWLLPIEPELNRQFMPSTFPRKKEIPNREKALHYLLRLSTRLKNMFLEAPLPSNIGSLKALFDYAKQFNLNDSCTLTRGLLQLLIFPMDEKLLGDPTLSLSKLLCNAMKEISYPTTLIEGSVAFEDEECNRLLDAFITDSVRILLKLYQAMGNNLARQRDRVVKAIDQMKAIQIDAERLDLRVAQLLENVYTHDGTTAFVYLMQMDWIKYIGDRLNNMQTNALDRAGRLACEGMKQELTIKQTKSGKDKKKNATRDNNKLLEKTKQKCDELAMVTAMHLAEASLCMGIVKTVTALIKLGKIKVPMFNEHSEEMRFAHRMAPMLNLGPPLHVNYGHFLDYSGYAISKDKSVKMIVAEAIDQFQKAKDNYTQVSKQYTLHEDRAQNLLYIAHYNQVAVRLLNDNFVRDKQVEFQFTERSSMYPLIKFI
ncbi:hypothetical protein WR25_22323 [Diploscapter pachys]|uniref:Protein MAK10 homolog n=1 Tax=Diploscapter pachys TaxID=2018661 RepID=A0A2A2L134_9BILA|nr:hypothetical protein WR25_22323 [Diploscapter pachys]